MASVVILFTRACNDQKMETLHDMDFFVIMEKKTCMFTQACTKNESKNRILISQTILRWFIYIYILVHVDSWYSLPLANVKILSVGIQRLEDSEEQTRRFFEKLRFFIVIIKLTWSHWSDQSKTGRSLGCRRSRFHLPLGELTSPKLESWKREEKTLANLECHESLGIAVIGNWESLGARILDEWRHLMCVFSYSPGWMTYIF